MLVCISPRFVSLGRLALALSALSTTACSSLTRPDDIAIVAEPAAAPAPTLRQLPAMPAMAPGGAVLGGAARAPGGGG